MKLRYTRTALRQLERILGYIEQRSPQGARNVRNRIRQLEDLLTRVPMAGQETTRMGMRRLVATPYPYCIFYRVDKDEVVVHGVRHTSRRPLVNV